LRAALDDWPALEPGLRDLAADLQAGRAAQSFALDFAALTAPLPRAAQFLDASGYLNRHFPDNLQFGADCRSSLPPMERILLCGQPTVSIW
jgi:hypothetical protein